MVGESNGRLDVGKSPEDGSPEDAEAAGTISHFDLEEIRRIALFGFDTLATRQRLLVHLGAGCSQCSGQLSLLAQGWASPLHPSDAASRDPLVGAVLRRLQVIRQELEPGSLRPVHEFWARREEQPFAFLRLMVEEGRHVCLEGEAERSMGLIELVLQDLERCRRLWLLVKRIPTLQAAPLPLALADLVGLALAHFGDEYVQRGDQGQGMEHYRRATEHLSAGTVAEVLACSTDAGCDLDRAVRDAEGSGNAGLEILATFFEIEAELETARGLYSRALELLVMVERLLVFCTIPGRRAEARVRRASVLLQLEDSRQARDLLIETKQEALLCGYPRLALEVIHQLVAAEVQEQRYLEARELLAEHDALYRRRATDWMAAQREWMLGLIALNLQGFGVLAARHLLKASKDLWMLGSEDEAFQVLDPLIRMYLEQRDVAGLKDLSPQIEGLMGSEKWRQSMEVQLRSYLQRAEQLGLDLPWLKVLLGWEWPPETIH